MSDRHKIPHGHALEVARRIFAELKEWCEPGYCKAVGSLRRQKPFVSDIEFLFVPLVKETQEGFFDKRTVNLVEAYLESKLASGEFAKRPNVNGHFAWGPKNKLAIDTASRIPLDLFTTTKENWWVSLVIRTGSKETNLKLTTGAQRQGATLNAYGAGVMWSDGTVTPATSEAHVFEMCGVPFKEARDR